MKKKEPEELQKYPGLREEPGREKVKVAVVFMVIGTVQ